LLRPGAEIGGILHKMENGLHMIVSYTIPPLAPVETPTCLYPGIVEPCSQIPLVNKHGRRFADEGTSMWNRRPVPRRRKMPFWRFAANGG